MAEQEQYGFYKGFLPFAGTFMLVVGIFGGYYAFSNARSGFGGIDNKLRICNKITCTKINPMLNLPCGT